VQLEVRPKAACCVLLGVPALAHTDTMPMEIQREMVVIGTVLNQQHKMYS
jgi:hypothetical protein